MKEPAPGSADAVKSSDQSAAGPGAARKPKLSRTRTLIVGILALGYALLAHMSTAQGGHGTLGAVLAIGPLGAIAALLAWRSTHRVLGLAVWVLALAYLGMHWYELKARFALVYLMQQVGFYCLLAWTFGRTLAPGLTPLCTQMALRVHGALSAEALRYTRQVTLAWTLFLTAIVVALIAAFLVAPLRAWSAFANFGVPALLVLMFLIEHKVRRHALPGMAHASIIATIRASAELGVGAVEPRS